MKNFFQNKTTNERVFYNRTQTNNKDLTPIASSKHSTVSKRSLVDRSFSVKSRTERTDSLISNSTSVRAFNLISEMGARRDYSDRRCKCLLISGEMCFGRSPPSQVNYYSKLIGDYNKHHKAEFIKFKVPSKVVKQAENLLRISNISLPSLMNSSDISNLSNSDIK